MQCPTVCRASCNTSWVVSFTTAWAAGFSSMTCARANLGLEERQVQRNINAAQAGAKSVTQETSVQLAE